MVATIHTMPVPSQRLFPAGKAAKYIGLSPDTLKKYTDEGQIKAFDFNGRRAYRLDDLDALIESLPQWQNGNASNPRRSKENNES